MEGLKNLGKIRIIYVQVQRVLALRIIQGQYTSGCLKGFTKDRG